MVSSVVKEQVYKLKLDADELQRKLQEAIKGASNFQAKMDSIDGKSVQNVEKATSSLSSRLTGLVSHIPIVGKLVDSMKGVGDTSKTAGDQIVRIGENAASGFNGVIQNANRASMGIHELDSNTRQASTAFSVLEGAAAVALGNIATQAINTATKIANKWTFGSVMDGFREYERELESTRVLVGALGEDQEEHITAVMRDLENYAKTTKYSSQQMNSSLAQFVNAGIDIDKAGIALKGWGNLAASAATSTANFNSSLQFGVQQALQMGYMNRQNWMSVQNASMSTKAFQMALLEAGREAGTVTDAMLEKYGEAGMFLDALAEKQWLTNDVLMNALEQYATNETFVKMAENLYTFGEVVESVEESISDAWSKMWVELIGKGEEAAAIWTPLGNTLQDAVAFIPGKITEIAYAFNQLEGRTHVIAAIKQLFDSLGLVASGLKKAIFAMIPESNKWKVFVEGGSVINMVFVKAAQNIIKAADAMNRWFEIGGGIEGYLILAWHNIFESIYRVFRLLSSAGKTITSVFAFLIPDNLIQDITSILGLVANGISFIDRVWVAFISSFNLSKITGQFQRLNAQMKIFWDANTRFIGGLFGKMDPIMDAYGDALGRSTAKFLKNVKAMFTFRKEGEKTVSMLETFVNWVKKWTDGFQNWVDNVFNKEPIDDALTNVEKIEKRIDKFYNKILTILDPVRSLVELIRTVGSAFKGLLDIPISDKMGSVKSVFEGVKKTLSDVHLFGSKAYADEVGGGKDKPKVATKEDKSLVDQMKDAIDGATKSVKKYADELGKSKTVTDAFKKVGSDAWGGIKKSVGGTIQFLIDCFNGLKERLGLVGTALDDTRKSISKWDGLSTALANVRERFDGFGKALKEAFNFDFSSKINFLKSLVEGLGKTFDWLAQRFEGASTILGRVFQAFSNFLDTFSRGLENNAAIKVGALYLIWRWFEKLKEGDGIVNAILHPIEKLKDLVFGTKEGSTSIFTQLSKNLRSMQKNVQADTLKKIGFALIELAGALWIVSTIPTDKLMPAVMAIATMTTILVGAYWSFAKIKGMGGGISGMSQAEGLIGAILDGMGFPEVRKLLKKMASATYILALATSVVSIGMVFDKLTKFNWGEIGKGLTLMGGIIAELTIGSWLGGLSGASIGSAITVYALAKAIGEVVDLIGTVNKIEESSIKTGMDRLGQVALMIASMMALMGFEVGANMGVSDIFNIGLTLKTGDVSFGTAATLYVLMTKFKDLMKSLDVLDGVKAADYDSKIKSIDYGTKMFGRIIDSLRNFMVMMGATFKLGADGSIPAISVGGKQLSKGGSASMGLDIKTGQTKWSMTAMLWTLIRGLKTIADVIIQLGSVDPAVIEKGSRTLERIMFALTTMVSVASMAMGSLNVKVAGLNIGGGGIKWPVAMTVGALVLGTIVLAKQIEPLGNLSINVILKGLFTMGTIMTALSLAFVGIQYAMGKMSSRNNKSRITKYDFALLAGLVAGIILLSGTVAKLSEVEQSLLKGLGVVVAVAGILSLALGAMYMMAGYAKKNKVNNKDMQTLFAGLAIMIGGVYILSNQAQALSEIDAGSLWNGVAVIGAIAAIISIMSAVFVLLTKFENTKLASVATAIAMIALSVGSLYILSNTIIDMSSANPESISAGARAMAAIALVVTAMTGILMLISKIPVTLSGVVSTIAILAVVAGSLYLLSGNVAELAANGADQIQNGAIVMAALAAVIGVMTLVVLGLSQIPPSFAGLVAVIATILVIVGSLYLLSEQVITLGSVPTTALKNGSIAMAAIAGILTIMTAVMTGLSFLAGMSIVGMIATIAMIVTLTFSLSQLGDVVVTLGQLSVGQLTKGGVALLALGAILTILTVLFGALAFVAQFDPGLILGMIPVIGIMLAIGPSLQSLAGVVTQLGSVDIGSLITGAIGALAMGVVLAVLTALFTVIAVFATFAGGGIGNTFTIANGIIDALKSLADVTVGLIPYASWDFLGALVVMGGLALILGGLMAIGTIMSNFTNAEGAVGQVTMMNGFVTAIGSLAQTAMTLTNYGDASGLEKSSEIIKKLGGVVNWNTITSSFGAWLTGDNAIDKAKGQVEKMKGFVSAISGLVDVAIKIANYGDVETLQKSADLISQLGTVLKNDVLSVGFWESLIGDNGKGGLKKIQNGVKAVNEISKVAKKCSELATLEVNFDTVSANVTSIKTVITTASNINVAGATEEKVAAISRCISIVQAMKAVIEEVRSMGDPGNISEVITSYKSAITEIQNSAVGPETQTQFQAGGMANIAAYASGILFGMPGVSVAADGIRSTAFSIFGQNDNSANGSAVSGTYGSGIGSNAGGVSGIVGGIVSSVRGLFGQNNMSSQGSGVSGTYGSGINSNKGAASSAANQVRSAAVDGLQADGSILGRLRSAGATLASTIGEGIKSAIGSVTGAVSSLWNEVKKHIPNSPAKKGPMSGAGWRKVEHSGRTIVETIASGMGSAQATVIDAIDSTMSVIQNEISNLVNYDYDDMQITPTITPVMDLTNVETSALQTAGSFSALLSGRGLNISYDSLNPQVVQMTNQASTVNKLVQQVNALNSQMADLTVINQEQAVLLREGQTLTTYLDGRRINNVLAPGMSDAQAQYTARQNRIKGGI